jgi:hypothetical protein
MKLNEYEEVILAEVIFPDEISINFKRNLAFILDFNNMLYIVFY